MFCNNCGKEINDNAVVCVNCGASVRSGVSPPYGSQPAYNAPPTYGSSAYGAQNDVMTGGLVALCILIPLAGLIVGIVKKSNGQVISGGKCITYSLVTWAICFVLAMVFWVFAAMFAFM